MQHGLKRKKQALTCFLRVTWVSLRRWPQGGRAKEEEKEILGNLTEVILVPEKFCVVFVSPLRMLALSQHKCYVRVLNK